VNHKLIYRYITNSPVSVYKQSVLTYNEIFPYQQAGNFNFTDLSTLIYLIYHLYTAYLMDEMATIIIISVSTQTHHAELADESFFAVNDIVKCC
jgi:hypothetical protein